jgi:hypothetical protein
VGVAKPRESRSMFFKRTLLVGLGIASFSFQFGCWSLEPHERALTTAFDGKIDANENSRYEFLCGGFDCEELLPQFPSTSGVNCVTSMIRDNLKPYGYDIDVAGVGACCLVGFEGLGDIEVHIYRRGQNYKIVLTEPRLKPVLQALADKDASLLHE